MRDRALSVFLMLLFGAGGIAVLVLAWVRPMPLTERILAVSVGSVGVIWVLGRLLWLRARPDLPSEQSSPQLPDMHSGVRGGRRNA